MEFSEKIIFPQPVYHAGWHAHKEEKITASGGNSIQGDRNREESGSK